jgi:hypothetical protein
VTKLNFVKLALAAAVLALPHTANAASLSIPFLSAAAAKVGAASSRSPAVSFRDVGKEVEPGIFQIDPTRVRGRRLILTDSGPAAAVICIGRWVDGTCYGIYIDTPKNPTT